MIRKLELLVPQFLKDIDKKLLLQSPGVWATKIHYVLFFGLAWLGLLGLRLLTQSIDLADIPEWEIHSMVLLVPAVIAFGIWVYYVSRFDVGKYFGKRDKYSAAFTHMLHLAAILLIFSGPLLYPGMLHEKISMTVNAVDLESDIHTLNMGDVYFPTHELEVRQYPDDFYTIHRRKDGRDVEALIAEHKVLTPEQRIKLIEDFKRIFSAYSDYEFDDDAHTIFSHYNQGKFDRFNSERYNQARIKVIRTLFPIRDFQWETETNPLFHKDFILTLFGIFYLWMATMVFLRIGWKAFLTSVVAGVAGFMLIGSVGAFFGSPGFLGIVFYFTLLMLFMGAFSRGDSKRSHFFQMVCLSNAIAILPFTLLILGLSAGSLDFSDTLLFMGSTITYICWATIFEQRFIDLKTAPVKR